MDIPLHRRKDKALFDILEQVKNCVCKIKYKEIFVSGFFCIIPYKNNTLPFLITSFHILDGKYIKENKKIDILLNDNKNTKTILQTNRIKYLNKDYDINL